ncbi:hypothetical protein BHE74_00045734 [Ensete ventricosum]|nr:hypothetical protein BHE74_00045734 [Ensete ventricosum]RZR85007.1 hypothetical protein BHM03_00011934 [Ensete ventricosum]
MDGAAEGAAAAAGVGGDRMSHKECVDGINKSLSRLSFTLGYGEFQSNPFGNVCGCCVRSHGEVPKGGAGEGRLPCVDAAAHGDHLQRPEFRRWLLQWPGTHDIACMRQYGVVLGSEQVGNATEEAVSFIASFATPRPSSSPRSSPKAEDVCGLRRILRRRLETSTAFDVFAAFFAKCRR